VQSGIWSLYLPVPVFWGVLAAWIPVPPALMAGVFFGAVAYALCNYLLSLREWIVDEQEFAAKQEAELFEVAQ
jgi:hypothetical protein